MDLGHGLCGSGYIFNSLNTEEQQQHWVLLDFTC